MRTNIELLKSLQKEFRDGCFDGFCECVDEMEMSYSEYERLVDLYNRWENVEIYLNKAFDGVRTKAGLFYFGVGNKAERLLYLQALIRKERRKENEVGFIAGGA